MREADKEITGVCVTYNTKGIIEKAFTSIRNFHPTMKIIIVDGSDKSNECYKYVCNLPDDNTRVFHVDDNIGHGRGLALAISYIQTPFFLTFDSDIEMLKSPLQAMLDIMEDDTCVVGYTEKTDLGGHDFGARPECMKNGFMKYVHPYFSLYQMKEYTKYSPFIHHGAPAVNIMLDIHRRGLADKVIKEFPGLGHSAGHPINNVDSWQSAPREFIKHDRDGTRISIRPDWDAVIDPFRKSITCITPTGDRLEAFALTRKWMASQTMQPDQWLVIDDGKTPLPEHLKEGLDYFRRVPKEREGHTLTLNMKAALPYIKGEIILIIEDDDWYGPEYIKTMYEHLLNHDLVGEGCARYYHAKAQKYYRVNNKEHASFCQTGFTRKIMPLFEKSIEGDPYIDMRFWLHNAREHAFLFYDIEDKLQLHCSLKGLKGRAGIGTGHDTQSYYYKDDPNGEYLKKWVGEENAKLYLAHVKDMPMPAPPKKLQQQPISYNPPAPVQIRPLPVLRERKNVPIRPIDRKILNSLTLRKGR
jgi:glycosyltransferase involved in cell wall biosynthesis